MLISLLAGLALAAVMFLHAVRVRWIERFREAHADALSVLVTVLATFCGVAWAITWTDMATDQRERRTVARLLAVASQEMFVGAADIAMDLGAAPNQRGAPPADPSVFGAVLENEIVLKHMTDAALGRTQRLRVVYARARRDSAMERTGQTLLQLSELLKAESQYQSGRHDRRWLALQMNRSDSLRWKRLAETFRAETFKEGVLHEFGIDRYMELVDRLWQSGW
ncbi:MAG TPA: hypothetical protein VGK93_06990 [Candidatus Eisenbacteria bacterium]|jgi:hypothetical protein